MFLLPFLLLAAHLRFTPHPIASDLKGGYQVVVADMNHDGKPDLIALASGMPELVWYENPGWQRHVIVGGMTGMINLAVIGNRIVLADHFANDPSKSQGHVYLLEPNGSGEWTKREIDRIPASHRLRTMMLDGKPVVVNAPLADPLSTPPDYRGHIPLVLYREGVWKREPISTAEEGVMHGIFVNGQDLFTASFLGIHAYRYRAGKWVRREVAKGDAAAWPKSGTSDVAVGKFTVAIEPWHGGQVVVYRGKKREVIDASLKEGHTIALADFDGDGRDEIVAGDRGQPGGAYVWRLVGKSWQRQTLEGPPMRANSCASVDLNADGRVDVACIGGATANLVWYENQR